MHSFTTKKILNNSRTIYFLGYTVKKINLAIFNTSKFSLKKKVATILFENDEAKFCHDASTNTVKYG